MGSATSYLQERYPDSNLYEIDITTDSIPITAFAVDLNPTSINLTEITDSGGYSNAWTHRKNSNNVLIVYTKDGIARTIGAPGMEYFFGYLSQPFDSNSSPFNVYWSTNDTISSGIDTNAETAANVFTQSTNYFLLTTEDSIGSGNRAPCFTFTCDILTPTGYKNITTLKKNDLVTTKEGNHVPIVYMYKKKFNINDNKPYCIAKDTYGKNIPSKDTYISRNHEFYNGNKWIKPIEDRNLPRKWNQYTITYYNIRVPNENDKLMCNGIPVVSLSHPKIMFANANIRIPLNY